MKGEKRGAEGNEVLGFVFNDPVLKRRIQITMNVMSSDLDERRSEGGE